MYRYQFRGFYPASRLPQPKNTGSQNLWRPGHSWKMFLGMVFRVQATPGNQRQGRDPEFHVFPANVDDREPLKQGNFLRDIKGKLCADKGYIGQALFENLFLNGIQLLTRGKNNMRNSLMSVEDKILLRKRALIETVNDELKNIAQIEHSRHRSFNNFIANALFLKRNLPLMSILSRIGNWRCFKLFRTYVI